jgi:putative ABC transport system substrate-binding protein
MRRRNFIAGLAGSAAAWPLAGRAQQPALPVVGFLHVGPRNALGHLVGAFRSGLAESDFVEGRNVAVEYRWAEGQLDRLPALAADLLQRHVSVIAGNLQAVQAVKKITATIPIVFVTGTDPVKLGLVKSFNQPGGNMTGVYFFTTGLEAKRLGLLRDVVPAATTIAVLLDPNYPTAQTQLHDVREAAARLGVQLVVARAGSDGDFDAAFATFVQQHAAALQVCASPFFNSKRGLIVALASRHKLPSIYEWREFAAVGGLLSYGTSIIDSYNKVGLYTGRILKGAKPADLPVLQPTKFELVINLKTAKALGIKFSDNFLTLADEVIE